MSYSQDGNKMIGMFGMGDENAHWKHLASINLDYDVEPNWRKVEEGAYSDL